MVAPHKQISYARGRGSLFKQSNRRLAWTFDRHLDGCPGFAIRQIDADNNNKETILPAMARFASQTGADLTTAQAPIQKFWWKDLYAKRGGSYEYLIVPMGGTP